MPNPKFISAGATRVDPLRGYKFALFDSEGRINCGFSKVSGLSDESQVAEYREGCDTVTMRKMPGLVDYENIVCERGLSLGRDLIEWRDEVVGLEGAEYIDITATSLPSVDGLYNPRRTLIIQLYDRGSRTIAREWSIIQAWPSKLDDGELDASSSDVVIESVEFCHEGLLRTVISTADEVIVGG